MSSHFGSSSSAAFGLSPASVSAPYPSSPSYNPSVSSSLSTGTRGSSFSTSGFSLRRYIYVSKQQQQRRGRGSVSKLRARLTQNGRWSPIISVRPKSMKTCEQQSHSKIVMMLNQASTALNLVRRFIRQSKFWNRLKYGWQVLWKIEKAVELPERKSPSLNSRYCAISFSLQQIICLQRYPRANSSLAIRSSSTG